ncbi:hypothetical protein B0H12DRAFT_1231926 [Mycena haematopus]|nr:hypothetical protein B0H12DRAFT_1231926 [Mycena haematopus]
MIDTHGAPFSSVYGSSRSTENQRFVLIFVGGQFLCGTSGLARAWGIQNLAALNTHLDSWLYLLRTCSSSFAPRGLQIITKMLLLICNQFSFAYRLTGVVLAQLTDDGVSPTKSGGNPCRRMRCLQHEVCKTRETTTYSFCDDGYDAELYRGKSYRALYPQQLQEREKGAVQACIALVLRDYHVCVTVLRSLSPARCSYIPLFSYLSHLAVALTDPRLPSQKYSSVPRTSCGSGSEQGSSSRVAESAAAGKDDRSRSPMDVTDGGASGRTRSGPVAANTMLCCAMLATDGGCRGEVENGKQVAQRWIYIRSSVISYATPLRCGTCALALPERSAVRGVRGPITSTARLSVTSVHGLNL